MPVPIADQDVDQACAQVRAGIDLLAAALVEALHERRGVRFLVDAGQPTLEALLQKAQHAAQLAERAQSRIVREHGQLRLGVKDTHRLQKRRDHHGGAGMRGAGQILEDVADHRLARVRIEDARRVLVHRAEHPAPPIGALEMHVDRLQPAAAPLRHQAPIEAVQVQDRRLDRHRPGLAPLAAEEEAEQPTRAIARIRHHRRAGQRQGSD